MHLRREPQTGVAFPGYGWQLGWGAEMAWQLLFQLEAPLEMMLCVVCLAVAFAALGRTLFNMYRSVVILD